MPTSPYHLKHTHQPPLDRSVNTEREGDGREGDRGREGGREGVSARAWVRASVRERCVRKEEGDMSGARVTRIPFAVEDGEAEFSLCVWGGDARAQQARAPRAARASTPPGSRSGSRRRAPAPSGAALSRGGGGGGARA